LHRSRDARQRVLPQFAIRARTTDHSQQVSAPTRHAVPQHQR
jgi:hypothetical protein